MMLKRHNRRILLAPLCAALLALAACNGTAVVTLTSTAAQDNFLAYRVALTAVELQTANGGSTLKVLPAGTVVDFARLLQISEVLGAAQVAKGTYTGATITLDSSAAQIVYDDGSVNGVALTAVDGSGTALTQLPLSISLDSNDSFKVAASKTSRLALDFKMAASNIVNLSQKTVSVTPLFAASAAVIDSKQVRIRGPIISVSSADLAFTAGVLPFDGNVTGLGQLAITSSDTTAFEINGIASAGTAASTLLGGLSKGEMALAYGTLTATQTLASNGTTNSDVSFVATEVLAGTSVQGTGLDRVAGVVSARSGATLSIEDATLVASDGINTFLPGTTLVNMGANTLVTVFGQQTAGIDSTAQVSVGTSIDAFGTVTVGTSGNAIMDASAGHLRIDSSDAAGLVATQESGGLILALQSLGGRSVAAFDFVGTGTSSAGDANAAQYLVDTGALDLTNATVGAPVTVSGAPNAFGAAPPDFTATALLDSTTLEAQLVVDWGAGTAAPFVTFDATSIDLNVSNTSIGARHQIQVGAQLINLVGLAADPSIAPNATASGSVFSIGHLASAKIENFETYAAFIAQLQSELNGTTLATGMTAVGQYTASSYAFSANGVTLFLND